MSLKSIKSSTKEQLPQLHPNSNSSSKEAKDLFKAITFGDAESVTKILKNKDLDINEITSQGQTPLHLACSNGFLPIVKLLINANASLHIHDEQGFQPLHCAAIGGHLDVLQHLLKKGADPNAKNSDRTTCLHYLARKNMDEKLEKTMKQLIKGGAQLNAKNKFGATPLHAAAAWKSTGVVAYLIKKKADIDARDKHGSTPLWKAVAQGGTEIVRLLLEAGSNPILKSEYGDLLKTAKEKAGLEGDFREIVDLLEAYLEIWKNKTFVINQQDERWKTLSTIERLKESPFVVKTDDSSVLQKCSALLNINHAFDFQGWITDAGVPKVPDKNFSKKPENTNHEYKLKFHRKEHENFMGSISIQDKGPSSPSSSSSLSSSMSITEPLIVSVATYDETDDKEYECIIWTIQGTTQISIPVELMVPLNSASKKLKKYLSTFFSDKHEKAYHVKLNLIQSDDDGDDQVGPQLLELEKNDPLMPNKLSVGVLYIKKGQTEEDQFLANEQTDISPTFEKFLTLLGDKIVLKDHKGYRGDLDVSGKNMTGTHSIYYKNDLFEIMFHVSVLLPRSEENEDIQQIMRKRYIGNDISCIVFLEPGATFQPLVSHFIHVYTLITPVWLGDQLHYRIFTVQKEHVPLFGPEICSPSLYSHGKLFQDFLITKGISSSSSSSSPFNRI
eukprot:TRINITY_DN5362_c0_g1_i1.p1 TRINITY_DN5362_c0_g1~~TRINITY_DN5362_c0_g1_i1.p1  ORF type:complete len:672 (-),score=178.48 TRINITY_DN5362_c0_g1_i1:65-2080(-)